MSKSNERFLQIGEVVERTGMSHRTLHYYEEIGLLCPSSRMVGGFRLYSERDVERLQEIRRLKSLLGFSLQEIKEIIEADETRAILRQENQGETDPAARTRRLEQARQITLRQKQLIEDKLEQLRGMRRELEERLSLYDAKLRQLHGEG